MHADATLDGGPFHKVSIVSLAFFFSFLYLFLSSFFSHPPAPPGFPLLWVEIDNGEGWRRRAKATVHLQGIPRLDFPVFPTSPPSILVCVYELK